MRAAVAGSLLAAVAVGVAACGGSAESSEAVAGLVKPCVGKVAVMAPYGGLEEKDSIQMNWARVALDNFNLLHGTSFVIEPANVSYEVGPGIRAAKRLADDMSVVGVVGPQTSGVTEKVGPILDAAGLAYVSPSATRASLTDGTLKGFYRVVPNDDVQGPAIGNFVAKNLAGRNVVVVDNAETYSLGLADSLQKTLEDSGVQVIRLSAPLGTKSYAAQIARIDSSVDVVVLPFLLADEAQRFVDELSIAGRSPKIVGGDSLFVESDFSEAGAYVSSYAPDTRETAAGADLIRLYQTIFGEFSPFGGPAYLAMEVVLTAALATCDRGVASRGGVWMALPTTRLKETILGEPIAFDQRHELVDGTFRIYQIDAGGYRRVG